MEQNEKTTGIPLNCEPVSNLTYYPGMNYEREEMAEENNSDFDCDSYFDCESVTVCPTVVGETCYDTCVYTCPETCPQTCVNTCPQTCANTCLQTCANTCPPTCNTCAGQYTCDGYNTCANTCPQTCPPCNDGGTIGNNSIDDYTCEGEECVTIYIRCETEHLTCTCDTWNGCPTDAPCPTEIDCPSWHILCPSDIGFVCNTEQC